MSADDHFFAMPSGESDMHYEGMHYEGMGDEPILLGAPPTEEPMFLGDVNESPSYPQAGEEPIILGPGGYDDGMMDGMMGMPSGSENNAVFMEEVEPEEPVAAEPSPMQKWNDQWQETLKQRKDQENDRKAQFLEDARAAMDRFQAEREQRREAKMATNRSDEQAKLEAIEADLENDNSWQRVCKMVEMSHDNKTAAQDVKRMREILVLLKNEPARATVLT